MIISLSVLSLLSFFPLLNSLYFGCLCGGSVGRSTLRLAHVWDAPGDTQVLFFFSDFSVETHSFPGKLLVNDSCCQRNDPKPKWLMSILFFSLNPFDSENKNKTATAKAIILVFNTTHLQHCLNTADSLSTVISTLSPPTACFPLIYSFSFQHFAYEAFTSSPILLWILAYFASCHKRLWSGLYRSPEAH